jgi:dihydroorotase
MANTSPAVDHPSIVTALLERARTSGSATVFPIAAITRGLAGKELSPIASLFAAGAVGISDDGKSVADTALLRRAMIYAKPFGVPILEHCEEPSVAEGGAMHEGMVSARLGLRGIPSSAEDVIVARDLILAAETGCRLHVQHVSTAGAVQLIREAKERGVPVTAEATPHHFTLTDESLERYDTNFKMNPPLRSREDLEAVLRGLADGTIDCIATDHAPHAEQEKMVEFDRAPMGILGLETLLGLSLTRLHHQLGWPLLRILSLLTDRPARVLNLPKGTLRPGADADVLLIDPNLEWRVDPSAFASKARNTPFGGWVLRGRAVATYSRGRLVWRDAHGESLTSGRASGAAPASDAGVRP